MLLLAERVALRMGRWGGDVDSTDFLFLFCECMLISNIEDSLEGSRPGSSLEFILLLANAGANMNPIDKFGKTPLHYAAIGNRGNVVVRLLNLGANPNIFDNSHHSPLALALQAEVQFGKLCFRYQSSFRAN